MKPYIPLVQVLLSAKKKRRDAILETLNKAEVECICELVLNGIAGEAKKRLDPQCVRRCHRHKKHIRALAFQRNSWQNKRQLIANQSGSGWFLPLIGTVLASLLSK